MIMIMFQPPIVLSSPPARGDKIIYELSVDEVAALVTRLCGSDEYETALRESNVDGAILAYLDTWEKLRDCGVTSTQHAATILKHVKGMKDAAANAEVESIASSELPGALCCAYSKLQVADGVNSFQPFLTVISIKAEECCSTVGLGYLFASPWPTNTALPDPNIAAEVQDKPSAPDFQAILPQHDDMYLADAIFDHSATDVVAEIEYALKRNKTSKATEMLRQYLNQVHLLLPPYVNRENFDGVKSPAVCEAIDLFISIAAYIIVDPARFSTVLGVFNAANWTTLILHAKLALDFGEGKTSSDIAEWGEKEA